MWMKKLKDQNINKSYLPLLNTHNSTSTTMYSFTYSTLAAWNYLFPFLFCSLIFNHLTHFRAAIVSVVNAITRWHCLQHGVFSTLNLPRQVIIQRMIWRSKRGANVLRYCSVWYDATQCAAIIFIIVCRWFDFRNSIYAAV